MNRPDLHAELQAAAESSSLLHLKRLEQLGVSRATVAALRLHSWGWGVVNAFEHPSERGLYCVGGDVPHLLLPVYDNGALVDLVAFRSSAPNDWLLRTGLGCCLGLERGLEPFTWLLPGEVVPLALSPLEWLQGGAEGLCVVNWEADEIRELAGVPHLLCSNEQQAGLLRKALTRPVRLPTISVSGGLQHAA